MTTRTFRMTLDTYEKIFKLAADGRLVLWADCNDTEIPHAITTIHPTTRQAALRRWQRGLKQVMNKYAAVGFCDGAHSVVIGE